MQVHAELRDLLVDRQQRLPVRGRCETGLAARSREYVQTNIDITNVMAVAQGKIDMLLLVGRPVHRAVGIHRQRRPEAAFPACKRPFPKVRHHVAADLTPVTQQGEPQHGLAELVLAVDVGGEVGLVDDIDQVR